MHMMNKILLLAVLLSSCVWAQAEGNSIAERLERKKFEEDQRQDEYANSLRRRDWLKDRLILGPGVGTKYSMMGKETMGFGAAAEYITRWHIAPFVSYGFVFKKDDPSFDTLSLGGGAGYRYGMTYYLFPKSPMHLGISASYGNVYNDHRQNADVEKVRQMVICKGYEANLVVSYLTDQWYFLNFIAGAYYIGDKLPGTSNPSMEYNEVQEKDVGVTLGSKPIKDWGIIFGAGIGFALPDLFPDDTEKRRRKREKDRAYNEKDQ